MYLEINSEGEKVVVLAHPPHIVRGWTDATLANPPIESIATLEGKKWLRIVPAICEEWEKADYAIEKISVVNGVATSGKIAETNLTEYQNELISPLKDENFETLTAVYPVRELFNLLAQMSLLLWTKSERALTVEEQNKVNEILAIWGGIVPTISAVETKIINIKAAEDYATAKAAKDA